MKYLLDTYRFDNLFVGVAFVGFVVEFTCLFMF